jgi:hypothetical protein
MKGHSWRRLVSALALLLIVPLRASSVIGAAVSDDRGGADSGTASTEQITILYDAFGKVPAMKKDWGFAALVFGDNYQYAGVGTVVQFGADANARAR